VKVNNIGVDLSRARPTPRGDCLPRVQADPESLLTRMEFDRTCLSTSDLVTTSVSIDGAKAIAAKAKQSDRTNVLYIMADDMRNDELQWMPNVQKLIAAQGVTFTNGFAGFPLCCPARASVLTGLYPHNHGVWSHEPPWGFSSQQDGSTFATWLQNSGYRTTYMGKYLNGYGNQPEPGQNTGTSTQYCPPGWDLWQASIDGGLSRDHPDDGGTYRYYDTTLNDNCDGYVPFQGRYQTHAYADLTVAQIEKSAEADQPWLSYVSFTAPHHGGPVRLTTPRASRPRHGPRGSGEPSTSTSPKPRAPTGRIPTAATSRRGCAARSRTWRRTRSATWPASAPAPCTPSTPR
jgi:arylsulfatase A-like enzyme